MHPLLVPGLHPLWCVPVHVVVPWLLIGTSLCLLVAEPTAGLLYHTQYLERAPRPRIWWR